MEHTVLSAVQLYDLAPTPAKWPTSRWYVVYLLSFTATYLAFDRKSAFEALAPAPPNRRLVRAFVFAAIVMSVFTYSVDALYGIDQYGVYDDERLGASGEALAQMPLLFRQVYGIVGHIGMFFIVKLALLLIVFLRWDRPTYRYTLYGWLAFMLVESIYGRSSRTEMVLTFLACGVLIIDS